MGWQDAPEVAAAPAWASAPEVGSQTPTKPKAPAGMQTIANIGGGLIRGAGSIGATLLTPYDLIAGNTKSIGNPERRAAMDGGMQALGVDTDSTAYGGGKLFGELAGTMGVGGGIANVIGRAAPAVAARAAPALDAVRTAGMSAGGVGGKAGLALRTGGGAVTGGASALAVNPEDAATGASVGAALPGAMKIAGKAGSLTGSAVRAAGKAVVGAVSPEVAALAKRAEELGIMIPVDRLTNSKPMNAASK